MNPPENSPLVEHFFRHEYGRMVARLSRRFGVEYLTEIEDAVQAALMSAVTHWTHDRIPNEPAAWLHRVALNALKTELRQRKRRREILQSVASELSRNAAAEGLRDEAGEDLLSMLFVACEESIPIESRLAFTLKTLCGFGVSEIAARLFVSEANVYKRLTRARNRLRESNLEVDALSMSQQASRLDAVLQVLYLLFTEGYLSTNPEHSLRRELCDEAIRLTQLLVEHPFGQSSKAFALLALMHLQAARMDGRQDPSGGLLLLEEQCRSNWNRQQIAKGLCFLERSAQGECFTRYHAEAAIAAEHCLAPSFQETNWERVAECYEMLEQLTQSPVHRLNRAVAIAELNGPNSGLSFLQEKSLPSWLIESYMTSTVMADLAFRAGHIEVGVNHRRVAVERAPTPQIRDLLSKRLARYDGDHADSV